MAWKLFWSRDRLKAAASTLLLVITSFLGGLTIAALFPVIQAVFEEQTGKEGLIQRLFLHAFSSLGIPLSIASLLIFLFLVIAAKSLLTIAQRVLLTSMQLSLESEKKLRLFGALLRTELSHLNRSNFGWLTSIVVTQTRLVGKVMEWFSFFLAGVINIVFYLGVSLLVSWKLAVLTAVAATLFYLIIKPLYLKAKIWGHESAAHIARMQELVNNTLGGYKVLKSYAKESAFEERYRSAIDRYKLAEIKIVTLEATLGSMFEPLALVIGTMAYVLFDLRLGAFVVFGVALSRTYQSLQKVQKAHYNLARYVASLELCDGMLEDLEAHQYQPEDEGEDFPGFHGAVEFRGLEYQFEEGEKSFHLGPLDMDFPKGKTLGLVGPSGSGKSTTVDMLMGFYPPGKGEIRIDGRDLSSMKMTSLRERIGYVAQDVFLLNDTVRNNVSFGDSSIGLEQVKDACRLAFADEFIDEFPEGYETMLGEDGTRLSGGQKQRISLARALAVNPEILILDEATSALDSESEKRIQSAIDGLLGQMTIIIIAHRLSTVRNADHIYVFADGVVIEEGDFESLLSREGRFRQMHSASQ